MSTLKANKYQHVDRVSPSIEINSDGSVSISSTVTYEDVTSVDAVGMITARSGLRATAGGLVVTAGVSTFSDDVVFTGAAANATWDKSANALVFNDHASIQVGTGTDLIIKHDGTNSFIIDEGSGSLFLQGDVVAIRNAAGTSNALHYTDGGTTVLSHAGTQRLATTASGISISDQLNVVGLTTIGGNLAVTGTSTFNDDVVLAGASYNVSWDKSANYLQWADSAKAVFGAGADLSLYHNGTHSFIENGTGELLIRAKTGENSINCNPDGPVQLYHDNTLRLATTTSGVTISNELNVAGITTLTGNVYLPDNAEVRFGASGDFQLFHHNASGQARIYNSNAAGVNIISDLTTLSNNANNETLFKATADGSVELYHNGSKKFETYSGGAEVTGGTLNMDSAYMQFSGNVTLPNVGACIFRPVADTVAFGINNGQRVSVNQYGLLFGTDTAAANALDDYEEGSFTPSYKANSANPTVGYINQDGRYTKIGNMVYFQIYMRINSWSGGSGALYLDNLPFTSISSGAYGGSSGVLYFHSWGGDRITSLMVSANSTNLYLYKGISSGTSVNAGSADVGSSSQLRINGAYHTSS